MNTFATYLKSVALAASIAVASTTGAHAAVLFADNFDTANLSKTTGAAKWNGITSVVASNDRSVSGNYSAKFTFVGAASIQEDAFSELRFDLGSLQPEVWTQFKLYVPSNYAHRSGYGSTNNKIFRLWGNTYDDIEKVGFSTWSYNGMSNIQSDWNYNGEGIGPKGNAYNSFITSSDLGKWMTIKIQVKAATATQKGTLRLWKNGALVIDNNGTMNSYSASNPHAYRYGYLLGWSNSGFTQTTYMYIDDVVFATTEADLGGGGSTTTSAPSAPSLRIN